jgi:hypothetical protein
MWILVQFGLGSITHEAFDFHLLSLYYKVRLVATYFILVDIGIY